MKALYEAGSDVYASYQGQTPLHLSAKYQGILSYFLDQKIDFTARNEAGGITFINFPSLSFLKEIHICFSMRLLNTTGRSMSSKILSNRRRSTLIRLETMIVHVREVDWFHINVK